MSDTYTFSTSPPSLTDRCHVCHGRRYLVSNPLEDDVLPSAKWCDECDRRGWVPSEFAEEIARVLKEGGLL